MGRLAVAAIESRARHQQFVQRQPWRVKVGPLVASALEAFVSELQDAASEIENAAQAEPMFPGMF